MSTAADLRFLFDNDFRTPEAPPAPPEAATAFQPNMDEARMAEEAARAAEHAEALAAAEAKGFELGQLEGMKTASEREEARMNLLMERLDQQFGAVAADVQARVGQVEQAAALMGLEAARRLAPALVASQPETEIAAFFLQTLKDFIDAPKLDIRLNPQDVPTAGALVKKLAAGGGYEGAIRVRADDTLARGDCIVGWDDGGARRDIGAVDAQLAAMVQNYFGGDDAATTDTVGGPGE